MSFSNFNNSDHDFISVDLFLEDHELLLNMIV